MTDGRDSAGVELTLPLDVTSVRGACAAVLDRVGEAVPDPRTRSTIELVIEEAVMNIVRHAFDDPVGHHFTLKAAISGPLLQLRFEDAGRPFDPTTAPVRAPTAELESAMPGGLGLPLLRRRTISMNYVRQDGRNLLSVEIALRRAP